MASSSSRVLVIGGTGHVGTRIVNASLARGHPTFVLARPPRPDRLEDVAHCIRKVELLLSFKQAGAHIIEEGSIEDHQSLVSAMKQVDVVICTIGGGQILHQLKLIPAIKEAGTIKRFLPSQFGMEVDRMEKALPPGDQEEGSACNRSGGDSPHVRFGELSCRLFSGGAVAAWPLPPSSPQGIHLRRTPRQSHLDGRGRRGRAYAIRAIDGPRTVNSTVYIRPPHNILSHIEVVEIWESLCGKVLEKIHISEEDWLARLKDESLSTLEKTVVAHFYHIFYKGEIADFDLDAPNQMEATQLYPDVVYTTVPSYLSRLIF